jgi:gamma-butyrobetaine dioxygenase
VAAVEATMAGNAAPTVETVVSSDGSRLDVIWPDGVRRAFAPRWLLDHADDARDPISGQRGGGALALEGAARLARVEIEPGALWLTFAPSGAERRCAIDRLRADSAATRRVTLWRTPDPIHAATPIPFAAYLAEDAALRAALRRVSEFGLAVLDGAGDDHDAVERAVARFGHVRETNYGRLFDVRIEPAPGNLAYTGQALDLHTDNPYRDPAPTLQLLHAIVADAAGGETVFVDGFAHAEALRREAPAAFEVLAGAPARFTYGDASGARWSAAKPVLQLGPAGALQAVNLNHRSLDLAAGDDAAAIDAWYEAYLAFYRRAHEPAAAFARRLAPGEMVIFDNRRLLHGRRALTSASPRWLRGCYADWDGLAATLARLEAASAGAPA